MSIWKPGERLQAPGSLVFINICIDIIFDSLSQLCRGHNAIMETGLRFVNVIKELLQRLLEYRKIIQNEIKEHRMSCIVNLLVSFFFYYDKINT